MNLNFGITPPQSRTAESLYKLAYQCAHSHTKVQCNLCANCDYNIDRYGWDPAEVKVIKARAALDYQQTTQSGKQLVRATLKGEFVLVAIVILLLLFAAVGISRVGAQENTAQHPKTIEEATALVRANLRDVNFDDRINCIDYAVIFYEFWPDSEIIRCRNSKYGFHHLLNKVGDRYIEPQVRSGNPTVLWAKEWPDATKEVDTVVWAWWATHRRW
jgi:hypothetical protein